MTCMGITCHLLNSSETGGNKLLLIPHSMGEKATKLCKVQSEMMAAKNALLSVNS